MKCATVVPLPGVTQDIAGYKITHEPNIYVLEAPGVLVPSIPDIETELKLALAELGNTSKDEFFRSSTHKYLNLEKHVSTRADFLVTTEHSLLAIESARSWIRSCILKWVMPKNVVSLLSAWWNWLGSHTSNVWNMVPACLMWLIWKERNARTFEDIERPVDCVKSLLLRTLFEWSRNKGRATIHSNFKVSAYDKLKAMEQTLAKGKQLQDDYASVVKKLRAMQPMLHSTEEQLRVHKKLTIFLTQLIAKTIPKGLHCLPLRLTTEYYTLNSSQHDFPNQEKLEDPQLYHYALFSDKVLAAAVVVNSTITYAKVQNIEEFTWLNASYSPVLKQLGSQSMIDYNFRAHRANSDSNLKYRNPKYLSILNHLQFYLPEIFPKLNKVLFLDDDIIVKKDLTALWSLDSKGNVNGAVETCGESFHHFDRYLNFSNPLISKNFDRHACGSYWNKLLGLGFWFNYQKFVITESIAHQPSIYVLDTPGVLVPSIPDIETGLKLALAGIILLQIISPNFYFKFSRDPPSLEAFEQQETARDSDLVTKVQCALYLTLLEFTGNVEDESNLGSLIEQQFEALQKAFKIPHKASEARLMVSKKLLTLFRAGKLGPFILHDILDANTVS
uniref:Hexosyltransferase n=1 Tax=Quercus lobata TaxID=97700 RepID=A0A7N2M2F3_QUELO